MATARAPTFIRCPLKPPPYLPVGKGAAVLRGVGALKLEAWKAHDLARQVGAQVAVHGGVPLAGVRRGWHLVITVVIVTGSVGRREEAGVNAAAGGGGGGSRGTAGRFGAAF